MTFIRLKALIAEPVSKGHKDNGLELNQMSHTNFRKVEFGCRYMPNFRNRIVDINKINSLAEDYGNKEAYTSMYFYPDKITDYVNGNKRNGKPSIAGYNGSVFSNYLFLDIDSKDNLKAKSATERLVSFCYDNLGCPEQALTISFSGNKGYHIGIDNRVFGDISPDTRLHNVYARLRKELQVEGRIETKTIDHKIKDRTRLWRLVNTQNSKGGKYKIQIAPEDFFRLNDYSIREMAREPQPVAFTDETGLLPKYKVKPVDAATEFYQKAFSNAGRQKAFSYPVNNSLEIDDTKPVKDSLCEARLRLFSSHVAEGERNNSALILSAAFRDAGFSENNTKKMILNWNQRNGIGLNENELTNVVTSAYSGNGYHFGCNSLVNYCPFSNWESCGSYREFKEKIESD